MIRDRREEDLDVLVRVLTDLTGGTGVVGGSSALSWLRRPGADVSWVFDQAPVSVTPTRNVVGHVQVRRPDDDAWAREVAGLVGRDVGDLRVVGRLFVKPVTHHVGIARHLLRQAVDRVESRGLVAAMHPDDRELVPPLLCERFGFTEVPTGGGRPGVLVRDDVVRPG
ncbi:hypothetical protein GCM10023340_42430 [Nocardioides marinquilinus]|uniref:N-acetyltransferase domain-containing protein n=1 Tax=Nocardioides marinquilinus TaxID=1210400 RepID=A0ABP9Q316_9ACTN